MQTLSTKFLTGFTLFVSAIVFSGNVSAQCIDTIPANTVIITHDTTITYSNSNFLVCGGAILDFNYSSSFNNIFIEPGGILNLAGYGYANVYVKSNAGFDANNIQYMELYYEAGATLSDTASGLLTKQLCSPLVFNYSLLPSGVGCLTSSVNKNDFENDFKIFPNPVKDVLNIQGMRNSELAINDIFGKKVFQKTLTVQENYSISVSDLAKGIYFLEIRNSESFIIKKFIKE